MSNTVRIKPIGDTMSGARAWSFLAKQGDRQYGGNAGYKDDPERAYLYDNKVPNHRQVQAGDIAVVRSEAAVLGIAEIEEIVEADAKKVQMKCPQCGTSNIKQRKQLHPVWRCFGGHEFDVPDQALIQVRSYEARYRTTFRACSNEVSLAELDGAVLRPNDQHSIKEIDLALVEPLLPRSASALIRRYTGRISPPEDVQGKDADDSGLLIERHRRVLREIAVRRGQKKFRNRLINQYGAVCQVTGCTFGELIEAAHIDPYSTSGDNSLGNGLLLRSDIHTLFDLGYLAIEPVTLGIRIHRKVEGAEYRALDGRMLLIQNGKGPDQSALKRRFELFSQ